MGAEERRGRRRRQEMSKAAAQILHSFIIIIYCKNNLFQGEETIPHIAFAMVGGLFLIIVCCHPLPLIQYNILEPGGPSQVKLCGPPPPSEPALHYCHVLESALTINSVPGFSALHERLCFLY